jgi:hypothetical protein
MRGKTSDARLRFYFLTGVTLLVLASITWLAFSLMTAREQARTPGEENYGVAVLGLSFLPVILVLGAGGVSFLAASSAVLTYRKIAPKWKNKEMAGFPHRKASHRKQNRVTTCRKSLRVNLTPGEPNQAEKTCAQ